MKRNEFNSGLASAIREERARATDTFKAGYTAAERLAADIATTWDTDKLRAAGGWSVALRAAFMAAVGDATYAGLFGHQGSLGIAFTVSDIADIRFAAIRTAVAR